MPPFCRHDRSDVEGDLAVDILLVIQKQCAAAVKLAMSEPNPMIARIRPMVIESRRLKSRFRIGNHRIRNVITDISIKKNFDETRCHAVPNVPSYSLRNPKKPE